MKHVSIVHATSEKRLAAMHCNEMKKLKARYETLFNARKRQLIKTKDEMKSAEQTIRNVKANGANLFLGIEQGSGKHSEDVQITMNPMCKREALSWIFTSIGYWKLVKHLNIKLQLKRNKVTK